MSKLSPQGASLLAAARKDWGSSAEAAGRVRAAVDARVASAAGSPDSPEPSPPSGTRLRAAMNVVRRPGQVLLVVLLGGALASSAISERHPSEPAPVHTLRPIAPAAPREPSAMPSVPVEALPEPTSPRASEAPAPRAVATTTSIPRSKAAPAVEAPIASVTPQETSHAKSDDLVEEARLLRRAQLDLQARRAAEAERSLDEHVARFPNGVLREEQLTLRVLLLCQTGDVAAARAKRAELDRISPSTSHAARLATSCAGTKDP